MPPRIQINRGTKFGRWTVISWHGLIKGKSFWDCWCDCGKIGRVGGSNLIKGMSRSCGCWSRDEFITRETTHGMTNHPLYSVYKGIKARCYNKNDVSYKNYGGRGIKMSPEWFNNFENFRKDMESEYKKGLTIERIDVNKNYERSNCIWIPKAQQARNRTSTIWVNTLKGTMTVTEAAKEAGTSWFAMYNRIQRKCPIEKLLLPPNKIGKRI